MQKVILFKNKYGNLMQMIPSNNIYCFEKKDGKIIKRKRTVKEIALRDVPKDVKFGIFDMSELPTDREFQSAWNIDDSLLIDGVGTKSLDPMVKPLWGDEKDQNNLIKIQQEFEKLKNENNALKIKLNGDK